MPASRPALGPQLLFQVLVLTLQAVVLAMHAAVVAVYVFVARQFVTQSRELPVLLLDDNVPSIPLGRGLFQDGEYAAQQAHAPVLSAPRIKTFTPTCGFFARIRRTPLNEDVRNSIVSAVPTHWDTRCGWSCALLNLAAATALRGGSITGDELLNACLDGVQASLPELQQYGYGAHVPEEVRHAVLEPSVAEIADVRADENSMGYTLLTLLIGLIAYIHPTCPPATLSASTPPRAPNRPVNTTAHHASPAGSSLTTHASPPSNSSRRWTTLSRRAS